MFVVKKSIKLNQCYYKVNRVTNFVNFQSKIHILSFMSSTVKIEKFIAQNLVVTF